MRVIFEHLDGDYYFEILLKENEIPVISEKTGLSHSFKWETDPPTTINVNVRKDKEKRCPS